MDSNPVDLTIIGGGPVGLFGAFYAGLRQMSVSLVDSLSALGGQLTALYPEKNIYDVPGFPQVLAKDLAYNLIEQAQQYHPQVHLEQQIQSLEYDESSKLYTLRSAQQAFVSRTLLISTGIGAFSPKMLPLENAPQYHRQRSALHAASSGPAPRQARPHRRWRRLRVRLGQHPRAHHAQRDAHSQVR